MIEQQGRSNIRNNLFLLNTPCSSFLVSKLVFVFPHGKPGQCSVYYHTNTNKYKYAFLYNFSMIYYYKCSIMTVIQMFSIDFRYGVYVLVWPMFWKLDTFFHIFKGDCTGKCENPLPLKNSEKCHTYVFF